MVCYTVSNFDSGKVGFPMLRKYVQGGHTIKDVKMIAQCGSYVSSMCPRDVDPAKGDATDDKVFDNDALLVVVMRELFTQLSDSVGLTGHSWEHHTSYVLVFKNGECRLKHSVVPLFDGCEECVSVK